VIERDWGRGGYSTGPGILALQDPPAVGVDGETHGRCFGPPCFDRRTASETERFGSC
jgi:hypothetical protein